MGDKLRQVTNKIAEELDLPKEIINGEPKIVVYGKNEIVIENHKGIESFQSDEIRINSNLGIIKISGLNLEIRFIGSETIALTGKLNNLSFGEA
ncbi:sporulation protein YqfC [Clostridium sp. B9]|uniref:sporulation protein YqfC n=1 Tax=Clostridium sp. B9 TaxID=3423224 RepID=UPI003D2F42A0